MRDMRFLPKAVTVCTGKDKTFDYKNNHECNKSANFWLDNMSKINCKMLIVLLYTTWRLRSRKI